MNGKVKNVVGYARISSDSQKDNTSISEQIKRIKAYCISQGFNLIKIYTDEAKSASTIYEREEYKKMMNFVTDENNHIDSILVYKSDRIHRHLKNLLIMIEDELKPRNISFISVSENFDTSTPQGMLTLQMLGSFAEFERNMINERTRTGRVITAEQGKYAGGKVPYGYTVIDGNFYINRSESKDIVKIFRMYSEGKSYNEIVDYLNNNKEPSGDSSGNSEDNIKKWSRTSICYILRNLTYTGLYIYDGKKEKNEIFLNQVIPTLISKNLFKKVEEMRLRKCKYRRNLKKEP